MSYTMFQEKYQLGQTLLTMVESFKKGTQDPSCDKKEIGFNKDDRFCSGLKLPIFISSLRGFYGNSGCSTVFRFNSSQNEIFKKYFIKYLNDNFEKITSEVGQAILADLGKEKDAAKSALLKQLKLLDSVGREDDTNDNQ